MSGESGVSVTVSVEVGVNTEVVGKSVQNLPQRRELAIVNHAQQVSPSMGYWGTCTSVVHAEVCLLSAVVPAACTFTWQSLLDVSKKAFYFSF